MLTGATFGVMDKCGSDGSENAEDDTGKVEELLGVRVTLRRSSYNLEDIERSCTVRRTAVTVHAQRVLLSHYAVGKVLGDAELVHIQSCKAPALEHGETDGERQDALLLSSSG